MEGFDALWVSACVFSKPVHAGGWVVVGAAGSKFPGRVLRAVWTRVAVVEVGEQCRRDGLFCALSEDPDRSPSAIACGNRVRIFREPPTEKCPPLCTRYHLGFFGVWVVLDAVIDIVVLGCVEGFGGLMFALGVMI